MPNTHNRQRLESVLLPGILVSWKHLDSPRCPLNEPFASLHVLGVYVDWALIPVFCLVLQFLESQVGLMMCGGGQYRFLPTRYLFLCISWPKPVSYSQFTLEVPLHKAMPLETVTKN